MHFMERASFSTVGYPCSLSVSFRLIYLKWDVSHLELPGKEYTQQYNNNLPAEIRGH